MVVMKNENVASQTAAYKAKPIAKQTVLCSHVKMILPGKKTTVITDASKKAASANANLTVKLSMNQYVLTIPISIPAVMIIHGYHPYAPMAAKANPVNNAKNLALFVRTLHSLNVAMILSKPSHHAPMDVMITQVHHIVRNVKSLALRVMVMISSPVPLSLRKKQKPVPMGVIAAPKFITAKHVRPLAANVSTVRFFKPVTRITR